MLAYRYGYLFTGKIQPLLITKDQSLQCTDAHAIDACNPPNRLQQLQTTQYSQILPFGSPVKAVASYVFIIGIMYVLQIKRGKGAISV